MTRFDDNGLHKRYGGYALVTGAARGIGRAFAKLLAQEGFGLLLVDRERDELEVLATALGQEHGVDARAICVDLAAPGLEDTARSWLDGVDVGLVVNNAGLSQVGSFLDISLDKHLNMLDVNCRATLVLTHVVGRTLRERGRGGVVIVSSASAVNGGPFVSGYAGTKGYGLLLGSSLWAELRGSGIDVLTVLPGMTDTNAVRDAQLETNMPFYIALNTPTTVARGALAALGAQPVVIPTVSDRLSAGLMSRFLPRSWALSLVKKSMQRMRGKT